jgi:hypothetical protein
VARPCMSRAAAMVETIVVIPSPARADLYALLQCGKDSKYGRKTYGGYIEVFQALLVEDGESVTPNLSNMQGYVNHIFKRP